MYAALIINFEYDFIFFLMLYFNHVNFSFITKFVEWISYYEKCTYINEMKM